MRGNIISYFSMCQTEGSSLQRGMNFRLRGGHSVILMSVRKNSPYQDHIEEEGTVLIYEGHDQPKSQNVPEPKRVDQLEKQPSGRLTENGKFMEAANRYKFEGQNPDIVRVYEKIKKGIWSDNGFFHLIDAYKESDGNRVVFKFKLIAIDSEVDENAAQDTKNVIPTRSRIIPTSVKLQVWERDKGKCVICGSEDELHFDHILPYAKGGTSLKTENIQLLCARHNLQKSAKIQ